jgi:hypothetical protein
MAAADAKVLRVLDANLNRAREGLRVLEDTARFVWEDKKLFAELRELRHALDLATRSAYPKLVLARGSAEDMGRTVPEKDKRDWKGGRGGPAGAGGIRQGLQFRSRRPLQSHPLPHLYRGDRMFQEVYNSLS